MKIVFVNQFVLFAAVWLIPATSLWWYSVHKKRAKNMARFLSSEMQSKIGSVSDRKRSAWQTGLILTGLALMMIAAARPQWGSREETVYSRGRDLIIALDVSRSMLASDVHPNRLERAKIDILDLIRELRGDRAGLLVFRNKANLLCPLTTDYAYLKQALDGANIDSAPRGKTDIGDALVKSIEAFENNDPSHKAIILISDGEDLSGKAIKAAEAAHEIGIPVFTIGIGSPQGARIPAEEKSLAFLKYKNKEVVTRLNNETLYNIALTTGGAYIPIGTASMTTTTLGDIYAKHLRSISDQDLEETLQRRHIERFQLFLLPGLLCVIAGSALSRGRIRIKKKDHTAHLKQLVVLIAFLLVASGAGAQTNTTPSTVESPGIITPPGREGAFKAQSLFKKGKFKEAAETYLEAMKGSSGQSQRSFLYNAAVSMYKAQMFERSAELFRDLSNGERALNAQTSTGLGSALYEQCKATKGDEDPLEAAKNRAKLLREAGESFKDAARASSDNKRARHNMAVAIKQLTPAEETARIATVMAAHQNKNASELAMEMLAKQREIAINAARAFTNNSPSQIGELENISREQKENADIWIPLKEKLLAAAQQSSEEDIQQTLQEIDSHIDATRRTMIETGNELRDLDRKGSHSALMSQAAIYHLWKGIAQYPQILKEDIRLQSNTISEVSVKFPDHDKMVIQETEALELTRLFLERFSQAEPEGGETNITNAATIPVDGTNAPPEGVSAEDRKKIISLSNEAIATQERALSLLKEDRAAESLPDQKRSYDILKEIEELLPKQQQQNQQQQDQKQDQQQQQDQEQQQDQQQQDQEQQEDQKPEPEEEKDETPEDVKKLLEKALQREKDHEDEKRRRNRNIPMSPNDKDW